MRADVTLNVNTSKAKRSMDRAAAEINRSINGISKKQISFNVNGKSFTQPLGRITASANEFTKSLEASNARVIAFGASVGIINGISEAFKALVVETVKFEKVLQDINVIVGASAGKLQEFGDGLFNVARNTAQAFTVSAEAALEFSRQGLTMEETLRRTNDALILTRLTGLDAASAVSGLTAAVNAFGDAGLSTTDIIDKLAAVDVKFAVSSEDLIKALERTGAVAIDAGVEIDSLIGLVTALQQTTARGGAVIGNGLKTIFTRIQRPESIRQLEEIGIAVKNLSGSILPADKIMINMAKSFDNLSQSQKSNIVQFSAGIFQANVFRAALRDLGKEQSIQAQATEIAGNAAGDAAQKNEMLNKTMSAMASQTTTSIQELAEILGTIGLAPDIDFFLSSIKDGIDGIKNTLGGGEDEGSTFAKGLVKGIGNVITGPAAIAFGAIFIKLFVNIAKFARTSLKDVLGIVNEKDKIRAMEESILKALGENVKLQEGLSNLEDDRKAQEMFILGIIEKQNSAMSEQVNLAARLAKPLVRAGINPDFSKNEASGMVPVAASGMIPESSKKKERQGAAQGGYAAGAIDSMNVKGVGTVVYNKAEKVKQFPGMSQPAIMPPKESRAGKGYKDAFAGQHGFDPYASSGFVPNFAAMNGGKLMLDPSLTQLSANPESVKGSRNLAKSYAELEATGQPISVEATTKQLLSNSGGSHSKKVKEVIRYLQDEGGVESIERKFKLKKLPKRGKRTDDQAEADVLEAEGGKYFNTGGRSGDPTFPVDLVGLGMNPIEVKSGEWKLPNVLLKSLRLYSDDGLMRFAESQGATQEMINEARNEKFKKGSKLLTKKGLIGKDASSGQTHQALLAHRMSEGLVPNFAIEPWIERYKRNKGKIFNTTEEINKAYGVKDLSVSLGQKNVKRDLSEQEIQEIKDQKTATTSRGGQTSYVDILKNLRAGEYKNRADLAEKTKRAPKIVEHLVTKSKTSSKDAARKEIGAGKNFADFQQLLADLPGGESGGAELLENSRKRGKIFEEILSDLGGVKFEENPDAMDFSRKRGRLLKVPEKTADAIGLDNYETYGDAHAGPGHGLRIMRDKVIREVYSEGLLKDLLLKKQVHLPGDDFPDIVNTGSDSKKEKEITLENLMKKGGLKSVKAREAINKSIKTNHGYTYDELSRFKPKDEKKPTKEENEKLQLKEELDKKIISFNYVTDDVDLEAIDKRTKTGRKVKELENLTSGNVSGGLIPNFADPRTRSQKIQDTLADPSNKGIKFNKPPSPANITSAQISRQLDIPIGKTPETQPSDEDIKNAINAVAQTREKLQLPGYENLKSIDKTKILKKYKKQAGEGEYYGNKDLSAARGFVPNFAKTFYDFDETLATYPSSVTSADLFNAESASLAEPTDLAKSLKGRTLDILTARAGESKPFISKKLKSWGINSGRIITTGSIQNGQTSAQKKATILQNMQKKNGGRYNLIDDAPENIAAIKALGNKNLMGQLYKFSGQHAGRGSGNAEGLVPNFANVNLYRGQKNKTLDAADISENLPSFASARTPDDVVGIVQDFVKRHVSGDLSGYRNKQGASGEKKASGANSYSTSPQVADNFANSIDLTSNDMSPGQVFQKTVPSKNIFNKAKLLKILNKGSDPKSGNYPSVEKFKKEIASGAVKNWAQKNGGMYLNISGVNNDDSSGKGYGQSMKQIVPPADVGYNDDGTRQIHQGEREVIQLFNNGLIPNFSRVEQVQKSQKRRVKEQVTEEDKDLAHNIFDYLKTNISNLSSRFRFNRSTVSFGGNPEDYEKVFNHSSSRKNKENLIEIARSEMRMNRILKGFMIPHTEGVSAARGKHKAPRDPFLDGAMHGGLVPNFADPLSAAISRERAAGVPQARIRVEKSSQLKSAQNPMGLAVTNTRDEPAGVQQGIRRAKTMGIDPKKHGASKGMVPNFASPQIPDAILNNAKNELSEMSKAFTDSFSEFSKIASQFGKEGKETLAEIASFDISKDFEGIKDLLNEKLERTEAQINSITEKTGKLSKGEQTRLGELKKAKSSGEALLKSTEEKSQKSKAVKNLSSSGPEAQKAQLIKSENAMIKKMLTARGTDLKSLKEATKASQNFRIALDESAKKAEESEDDGGGLQRLFYLQSAISLVNGQFETLAEGASGLTKTFAQGMLAISNVTASYIQQKELVSEGMNMAGVKRNESFSISQAFNPEARAARRSAATASDARARGAGVGRMGGLMRNLSGVGRMFGRFLPVIGQLYTGFTVVNEAFKMFNIGEMFGLEKGSGVMDLLSSQGERAAKKLEKLGESTEKLQGALESLNSQTENREKVTDLEILGSRRTQKQELELQQLKLKGLDIDIKAQDALSGLLDENLVGTKVSKRFIEELSKGTNSNEDYVKVIERVIKAQKNQAAFLSGSKSFGDLIDKKLDKFNPDSDDIKLLQGASKVRGSQIGMGFSSAAAGGDDMDVKDRLSILNKNIAALERESSTVSFRSMSDVTKLTDRLAKNLQGTEDFDAEMMASQINSFIKNVDESIDNPYGLDPRETKAVNAGMKQMVIQLNKLKKNLEGESDRQQEAQLKKKYVTAYKNIIFNIEQFRKNEAHLTKLSLASLTHQNKLNSSQQSLLLEYGAIGKEAAISSDFARKRNAMEAKFIADKQGIEMKSIESLNKLRDTYFNTDQLAQQFKKDGEGAAQAVQALKENIEKGVTAADFAGIGKVMDLDPGVMAKVTEAFEQTSAETKHATSSLEVISSLLNKFGKATDSSTASALLLALHEKKLVTLTDEHLNLLRSGLLSRERLLELLNTGNKEAQQLLKLEEEHKFIKEKTVAGAAKLYNILEARGREEKDVLESVKGEAATLAVLNDFYKKDVSILAKSVDVMELGFQKQVDKNRTEAISAVHSLRMLEAQTGSLKISNDSLIILESKLKSETENAELALQESEFRLDYLKDQSKREELVGRQLAKEMSDLKTSNLLAAEKNLQLSKGKKLSELVSEQLKATLHSSRLEALTAAENALLLTGKTKQVKLIQEANELQEASNKLTELQNAVTKAGVSDKTLRMTTTADIGIEKANSILGTRTAGMKATVEPNADNMLAYANSLEQTNKLLGNGSRVMDRFRTKMAEINVEAENLGADLVDIGIDNARSGLKQMFDDIGSGAKSAKEAWNDFGLGLAKTLLDRMTQNNIDKIVKNLTFAFTGEEGKSDAEKIASETAHLVGVNEGIISSNQDLISAINGQTEALKKQIDSETPVNKPKTNLIPENTAGGKAPFEAAQKKASEIDAARIKADLETSNKMDLEVSSFIENLYKTITPLNQLAIAATEAAKASMIQGPVTPKDLFEAQDKMQAFKDDQPLLSTARTPNQAQPDGTQKGSERIVEQFLKGPQDKYGAKREEIEKQRKDLISSKHAEEKKAKKIETKISEMGHPETRAELKEQERLQGELEKTNQGLDKFSKQLKESDQTLADLDLEYDIATKKLASLSAVVENLAGRLNVSNEPPAKLTRDGQMDVVALLNKHSGGKIQHFAKGGFVDGPAGVDKVPAMLTAGEYVVPKDKAKQFKQSGGEIQNFLIGGMAKELNNENSKNRAIRGAQGVTQLLVMNEVSRGMAKYLEKPKDDGPPTFDRNKFNNLDLRSDVNIKRGDPRLSARFLAKDPVMQEYKDYLLEKAAYDVEKKNQKVDKKMQTIGSVLSFMGSFAIGQMSEIIAPYVQKAVGWAKDKAINTAMGHTGLGKHSDAFKQARKQNIDMDYSDLKGAESTGHLISNDNEAWAMSRDKTWKRVPEKTLSHRGKFNQSSIFESQLEKFDKNSLLGRQSGGSIPAMLTAGEGFVPAPVAKRIGYDNLNRMNTTGGLPIVQGKGGIDNVGPVGLTEGDFIIKKSSTDKLLRENPNMMRFALQNPEGFKRGEQGYYEGGVVGSPSTIPAPSVPKQAPTSRLKSADPAEMLNQSFNQKQEAAVAPQQKSEVTNNINVNVSIDQAGKETVSTENSNSSYEEEQQLSLKIKSAVLDVIRQEKRIGGELSS